MPHVTNRQVDPGTTSKLQTTAGTTQADAQLQVAGCFLIPTVSASGAGVLLKAMPDQAFGMGINADTSKWCVVYPPVGVGFNGATTNLGVTLPPRAAFWYWSFDSTTIGIVVGTC